MPSMKEKIKNLFGFLGRAWVSGARGKMGIAFTVFAIFMLGRLFVGEVTVQKSFMNIWHLSAEREQLSDEKEKLRTLNRHIELLQNYSPDYVEELGLKYLNIGDPRVKILKI